MGWSIFAVLLALNYYVGMWPYHDYQFVYFGQVAFFVLSSLFFTLFAYALTPDFEKVRFSEYFEKKRKTIYFSLGIFLVSATPADTVIAGVILDPQNYLRDAVYVAPLSLMAFVGRRWIHLASSSKR